MSSGDEEKNGTLSQSPAKEVEQMQQESGKDEQDKVPMSTIIMWTTFYLLCSSSMLPVNKMSVVFLPAPNTLLLFQTLATVVILLIGRAMGKIEFNDFEFSKAMEWMGVMLAWMLPMVVNMTALKYTSVETIVIFRILSTFGVAVGDYLLFQKTFTPQALTAMTVTVGGGILYGYSDANFSVVGYVWGALYFAATIFNGLYIKLVFNRVKVSMSNWEKTYYNNLMAVPIFMGLAFFTDDSDKVISSISNMSLTGFVIIIVSGIMGTAISVAGTNTRDLLTATSFNIAGNANKFLSVGASVFLMGSFISSLSAIGLVIALFGGAAYAMVTAK